MPGFGSWFLGKKKKEKKRYIRMLVANKRRTSTFPGGTGLEMAMTLFKCDCVVMLATVRRDVYAPIPHIP